MSNNKVKNKGGRQWFNGRDTAEVKKKLEEAYSNALPLTEVLLYCGISKASLFRYLKANEKLRDRLHALRKSLNITARSNVAKSIKDGDLPSSWRWLEHKDEEFKKVPSTKKISTTITKNEEGDVDKFEIVIIDSDEKLKKFKEDEQNNSNTSLL